MTGNHQTGVANRFLPWGLFAGAVALLLGHSRYFQFITDDAYISFIYSRNFSRGLGLVYNAGERVEGYTNFLWTLFLGVQMKLGISIEWASLVWGQLFAIGTMGVLFGWGRQLWSSSSGEGKARSGLWPVAAPVFLGACGAFACWASGGLETQMFTFFVTLGFWAHTRRSILAGLWFGLAALTRPEGNLLFAFACLHDLLSPGRRFAWRTMLLFVGITLPHWIFRWSYYGYPFPNTFYIKSSGGGGTAKRGLFYLGRVAIDYGVWLLLPLAPRPLIERSDSPDQRRIWSLALVATIGFAAYVMWVGGDFMGLYRFVLPLFPLLALVAAMSLRRVAIAVGRWPGIIVTVLFFGSFGLWSHKTSVRANTLVGDDPPRSGLDTPAFLRKFADDRALIGKQFAKLRKPGDSMTVGGAGAQVFYADMPATDAFGLTDAYIAHHVPSSSNRPGHQKWAPDSYLLGKKPAFACHHYRIGAGPYVPSPSEAATFGAMGYRWESLHVEGLKPPIYSFLVRMGRLPDQREGTGDRAP